MADLSKLVNELSELTVLEAAELTKILEEKWGVNATGFAMQEFISEADVATFEGWLSQIQGLDPTTLAPDESEMWRRYFDELKKAATPKVGLMKLRPLDPGEHRYAVAIRDNSGLWLTLWVRRSPKGEFFVMAPRAKPGWDPHVSYHLDGTFHSKSFGKKHLTQKRQPLTGTFTGTEHLGAHGGHGVSIGAACDPTVFTKVVEVAPSDLTHDDQVVVDLVEPGHEALSWPGELVKKEVFKDATLWVVIRIIRQQLPGDTPT